MTTSETQIGSVEARLAAWDRERRQALWIGGVLLTACLALSLFAARPFGRKRALEAESLTLRDNDGRVRASLALAHDGSPSLTLFDSQGREQCRLQGHSDDSTTLTFNDRGKARVTLSSMSNGSALLSFTDRAHNVGTGLYLHSNGETGLATRTAAGETRLATTPDGRAEMRRIDPTTGQPEGQVAGLTAVGTLASQVSPTSAASKTPELPAQANGLGPVPAPNGHMIQMLEPTDPS